MSFDLPHMLLIRQAHERGVIEGRELEAKEVVDFILKYHPQLAWLATAIIHGEHK
jgi:hypothetical protein